MKTIELKWIEDDNNVVAKQANTGLQDLIDTGVFKTITSECKDDTLYITGEKDELDKAVMKIQKAYAEYGQIMIKEAKKEGGLRIESYDDNVQEIFDYTVKEFDKLKENKHSADYITKLGDLQIKFMKLKEAAGKKDKSTIQNYLDEISTLTENAEIKKIKPIKKINEDSLDDFDDSEINASIAAQSAEVKKFVEEQQNLIYNYVKKKWISLCEKYKIDRDTYYEVTCDTSFGNGREPGSTFFMHIKIDYLKQFLNAIKARNEDEAEKWLYTQFCSADCPFKVSPAWKPEVYNSGDYKYKIRIGFIIPEYTPKKPRKPRKPRDPNKGYKKPDYVNPDMKGGTYFDGDTQVYEMPEENEAFMIKTAKDICEAAGKKVVNPENVDTIEDVEKELQALGYNELQAKGLVKEYFKKAWRKLASGECAMNVAIDIDEEYMKESVDNELTKHLGNLKNWGIIEESMTRKQYNAKYDEVALAYAKETGMDLDDAYDELMDIDELVDYIEGPYDVDEIVYKLMNESTNMNESFLSPAELKKKLQRVAMKWASEEGIKYEIAYNDLRKRKSVKDMLDFYTVDEIIDDLKKKKKEVDDELEEEI